MDGMNATAVFSAVSTESFTPVNSPRTYTLAPLTYRQRQEFRRELRRQAGEQVDRATLLAGLRNAVVELAPDNLLGLLSVLDEAAATVDDPVLEGRVKLIERLCATVPSYAALLDEQQLYLDTMPFLAAQYSLRGWSGPDLPPFEVRDRLVPAELLDLLPAHEVSAVGWRGYMLMNVGASAEGNSPPPSPSPATRSPSPAG